MRNLVTSLIVAGLAVGFVAQDASARPRKYRAPAYVDDSTQALPLTVNRRSFLDPGPVAPVGTGQNYVSANTIFNKTPDQAYEPSRFGGEVLQGQPYVPGRTVSVVEFATGPRIGDLYVAPVVGANPLFNP